MKRTLKELNEERGRLAGEIRRLADAMNGQDGGATAEQREQWDKVNADYNAVYTEWQQAKTQADYLKRAAEVEKHGAETREDSHLIGRPNSNGQIPSSNPVITDEHRALAMAGWFAEQTDPGMVTERQMEACRLVGLNPRSKHLNIPILSTDEFQRVQRDIRGMHPRVVRWDDVEANLEKRAMSSIAAATGGVTVPQSYIARLEMAMLQFGPMLRVADVMRTADGSQLTWPTVNNTGNKGRQIGESKPVAETDANFGAMALGAYKFTSDEIKVPYELFRDSVINMAGILASMMGELLGRILNEKFTTGGGNATVRGIVPAAHVGKTTASTTAIAADEIIDLEHSLDPAYRPMAQWMFHDNVLKAVKKLKDGQNNYLWMSGFDTGSPDTLLGYPININQDMASSIAASARTMIFGDLNKYKIRQVGMQRTYRLTERHRENDQDAFLTFIESDGNLLDAGTHPVVVMQQAAA